MQISKYWDRLALAECFGGLLSHSIMKIIMVLVVILNNKNKYHLQAC